MKAQELRIGNYVNGIYSEGEFIGEVLTVDLEGCLIDTNSIGIYDLTSLKNIKPIPLTEKWLVKFGFEKVREDAFDIQYKYFLENKNTFRVIGKSVSIRSGLSGITISTNIEHVHQLQNLYFALTGEELKTKL